MIGTHCHNVHQERDETKPAALGFLAIVIASIHRPSSTFPTSSLLGLSDLLDAQELRDNRHKRVGRVPVEVVARSVVGPCRPRVRVAGSVLDIAQRLLQQPLASPSKLLQVGAWRQVAASSLCRSNRQS